MITKELRLYGAGLGPHGKHLFELCLNSQNPEEKNKFYSELGGRNWRKKCVMYKNRSISHWWPWSLSAHLDTPLLVKLCIFLMQDWLIIVHFRTKWLLGDKQDNTIEGQVTSKGLSLHLDRFWPWGVEVCLSGGALTPTTATSVLGKIPLFVLHWMLHPFLTRVHADVATFGDVIK